MSLSLRQQKQIFTVGTVGFLSLTALFGISSWIADAMHKADIQHKADVKHAQEIAAKEAAQEKILDALEITDQAKITERGFSIDRQLSATGQGCNTDGTTDDKGYFGNNTSLSYDVTHKETQAKMRLCFDHTAGGIDKNASTSFVTASALKPRKPQVATASRDEILKALMQQDVAYIQNNGGIPVKPLDKIGNTCNPNDARTNNTGYNGNNTAIAYGVKTTEGKHQRWCLEHTDGKINPNTVRTMSLD